MFNFELLETPNLPFLVLWISIYLALACIYLCVGVIVEKVNKFKGSAYKIQSLTPELALVRRDQRKSLISILSISAFLAVGIVLRQHGYGVAPVSVSLTSIAIGFISSMLLFDTWFYWTHRLLHHRAFYVRIHQWHHRSKTPSVWANNSDRFLDNIFCQSYWFFAALLLPIPVFVLLAHKVYDQMTGMLGHAGYEYAPGLISLYPSPFVGTTFHDQHHSAFNYNFGTHFSIWDRLMGTVHPDYDSVVQSFPRDTQDMHSIESNKQSQVKQ